MNVERDGDGGTGSACRRKQRRLHSFFRHGGMAVAMAVAERLHHLSERYCPEEEEGGGASLVQRLARPENSQGRWRLASTSV